MRIGYNAPYNESCEVRDNIIVNGGLDITKYKQVVQSGNLVVRKGEKRPAGTKSVLLPNRFDPDRAHLVVYDFGGAERIEVPTAPFLKTGDAFRLMDPKDLFGEPIAQGKCRADAIRVSMKGEFAVFLVLRGS